jgi:hypothetical protein
MIVGSRQRIRNLNDEIDIELNGNIINKIDSVKSLEVDIIHLMSHPSEIVSFVFPIENLNVSRDEVEGNIEIRGKTKLTISRGKRR